MFDPFGDAKTAGYLRNFYGLPLGDKLKEVEHHDVKNFWPDTIIQLARHPNPGYPELLKIHEELFGGIYPWAGKDRFMLFPNSVVNKGTTQFALSNNIEKAFHIAMDPKNTLGQRLGHLAYSHPFLEGNGRAIFTFFDDHLRRQGVNLNWPELERGAFLKAIDKQIARPNEDHLDNFLEPHLGRYTATGSDIHSSLLTVKWQSAPKR